MTPSGRRRIDEIGDESRRRILDAAEELFAERGFDRTSFVDIAERSGISRGSIPWHFKNKEGLVLAVVDRAMNRFMDAAEYAQHETLPTLSEVMRDFAAWVRSENSALMFMILSAVLSDTGTMHEQYRDFLNERRQGVVRWLRAQRPEGLDPDAATEAERAVAVALNGTVIGIHFQALVDPDRVDLDAALQSLGQLVDAHLPDIWTDLPRAASNGAKKRSRAARAQRR